MSSPAAISKSRRSSTEKEANPQPLNWTPLHEAVLRRDLSAVTQLLKDGADPNAACEGGITPVMVLCLLQCYIFGTFSSDDPALPSQLHEHLKVWQAEAEVNAQADTKLLQLLLSQGARVDLLFPGGFDMLEAAAMTGMSQLVHVSLRMEPFSSMLTGTWEGSSSNSAACSPEDKGAIRVLDRCSQPLRWTAEQRNEDIGLHILRLGWKPRLHPDDAGKALLIVCRKLRYKHALDLIKAGTDVNFQISHETPLGNLTQACYRSFAQDNDLSEQLELARLLVAKGARTADGASPVQCAVVSGWLPLLQACVEEGAVVTGPAPFIASLKSPVNWMPYDPQSSSSRFGKSRAAITARVSGGGSDITLLEVAVHHEHYVMTPMLIALGGRFSPSCTLEQLLQLQDAAALKGNLMSSGAWLEITSALLLAGLLRHVAQQAGQQDAVAAYDMYIAAMEEWLGLQQEPDSSIAVSTASSSSSSSSSNASQVQGTAPSTTTSSRGGGCSSGGNRGSASSTGREAVAPPAAAAAATGPVALCTYAENINLSADAVSSASSSGVQAVTAPPRSSEARPVMLNVRYFEGVCRLLRHPADMEQLLGLLSRLHADDWGRYFTQLQWAPLSIAMRHLQHQHTLQAGSLVSVCLGLKALLKAVIYTGSDQLHAIHSWALGRTSEALPLPLLLLLGVDVNKPWRPGMYSHKEGKLQDAVGNQAPPLALALSRTVKWTTEVQQQRMETVRALVAAGASYSWEGPAGATVLSLAAELLDPAFLQALLARPNALQAFTAEQVSAALVAAEYICERNGCLLMQAVADYQASAAAAAASLALTPAATAAVTDLLVWCVEEGDVSTLLSLLAAGADPNAQPSAKSNNWPVLHELVFAACQEDRTMDVTKQKLEELLKAGADINATNNHTDTPLIVAFNEGRLHVAKLLLEYKPDLWQVDGSGNPPIGAAALGCGLEGIKQLLQAGSPLPKGGIHGLFNVLQLHASLRNISEDTLMARFKMLLRQYPPAGRTNASGTAAAGNGSSSSRRSRAGRGSAAGACLETVPAAEAAARADRAAAAAAALLAEEEAAAAAAAAKAAKKQRQAEAKAAAAAASMNPEVEEQDTPQAGAAAGGQLSSQAGIESDIAPVRDQDTAQAAQHTGANGQESIGQESLGCTGLTLEQAAPAAAGRGRSLPLQPAVGRTVSSAAAVSATASASSSTPPAAGNTAARLSVASLPASGAIEVPAGSFDDAGGVDYITPLPWLPSLRVPLARSEATATAAPVAEQVSSTSSSTSSSAVASAAVASGGIAGSAGSCLVANLPWLAAGSAGARDVQDARASPLLAPGISNDAATDRSNRQADNQAMVQSANSWSAMVAGKMAVLPSPTNAAAAAAADSTRARSRRNSDTPHLGEKECVVCWEAPPAVQLLPCKHTVLCRRCSDALRKQEGEECPMCRSPVQERVNVSLGSTMWHVVVQAVES